ncbi:MAG: DUF642 domain-containing protein [Planctomycetes bacterium]|nr:DUF642 domain-containing protein [Planctomycetota bacterium]
MARIRNVTGSSFQIQIDEWDYLDGAHAAETVGYLVVEAGCYTLPDGTRIDAGTVASDHRWYIEHFRTDFGATPVVLTQCQTAWGGEAVVTRQQGVSRHQFSVCLQEQERSDGAHAVEVIGYVAIEPRCGALAAGRYEVARTPDQVTDRWYRRTFTSPFTPAPVLLACMQTFDGSDPASLRHRNLGGRSVEIRVQEETSGDRETSHTTEVVGYAAFGFIGVVPLTPLPGGPLSPNLIVNGSFEEPRVSHSAGWDIFRTIPGWRLVDGPNFELQRGILGGPAHGAQHLELDADVNGPNGGWIANERGGITVAQQVATVPGQLYTLSFAFAGRPGTAATENVLGVEALSVKGGYPSEPIALEIRDSNGAVVVGNPTLPGNSGWRYYTTTFVATETCTEIRFGDRGASNNTYGSFLDDVQLRAVVVRALVEVKPGDPMPRINLASQGVIPVAVLTTRDLDAAQVELSTVRFAGAAPVQGAPEDVNGDGRADLILHFRTHETDLLDAYAALILADIEEDGDLDSHIQPYLPGLTGRTTAGVAFTGEDYAELMLTGKALRDFLGQLLAGRDF